MSAKVGFSDILRSLFLFAQPVVGTLWEVKQAQAWMLSLMVSPLQDPAAEARMKVACITEQVLTLVNKRIGLYRHFDETVNRYKQSRDVSTLNSGKKSLETEHKALTSEIALLQSRLKTEGSDLCDKVSVCHPRVTWVFGLLCHAFRDCPPLQEHHGAALGAHAGQLLLNSGFCPMVPTLKVEQEIWGFRLQAGFGKLC